MMAARKNTFHATTAMAVPQKKSLQCTVCGKLYDTNAGLYKHRRAKHPHMVNSIKSIPCKESNCDFTCKILSQLRCHLEKEHGMPMETTVMNFKDIQGMRIKYVSCIHSMWWTSLTSPFSPHYRVWTVESTIWKGDQYFFCKVYWWERHMWCDQNILLL